MKTLIYLLLLSIVATSCVVKSLDDLEDDMEATIPDLMRYTVTVDKIEALKSCKNDGNTGKADIYTKISLHKNDVPNGSSWGVLAQISEVVVEIAKGETILDPGITIQEDIVPFDSMRVEYIMNVREVDPNSTQIQDIFFDFIRYDGRQMCFVDESNLGLGTECLEGSIAGSSTYRKTRQARLVDDTCDVILTYTVSLEPI